MYWWVAAIIVALAAIQMSAIYLQRRDFSFEKAAVAVQALATTLAIMFAGYWYIYERKGQPQANIALEVVGVHVAPDYVMLEARFTISNLGSTLLEVGGADARLLAMNADSLPLSTIVALPRTAWPDRIDGKDVYDDGTLMWPMIRWFSGGGVRHVEPGETDLKVVDFIASCRNTAMRVYFAMKRPGTDQAWQEVADVSVSGLCANPVGSRQVLSARSGS